mgnify:CR=1 FL=1
MKVQTKDLIGPALDWMVAKCEGELYPRGCVRLHCGRLFTIDPGDSDTSDAWRKYRPSTDPAQGHPIIERESIDLHYLGGGWEASIYSGKWHSSEFSMLGLTALIAAMRCYVASKLGEEVEEVEIPDELCGVQDDIQALVDYVDGR